MRIPPFLFLFICISIGITNGLPAEEGLPEGCKVIALEFGWRQYAPPVISPDGKWLAYPHQNGIYLYNFGEESAECIESAESLYRLIKDPAVDLVELSFDAAVSGEPGERLVDQYSDDVGASVSGLQWTADSQSIVFALPHPPGAKSKKTISYVVRPIDGELQLICTRRKLRWHEQTWELSKDQKYLVIDRVGERPLIWNTTSNRAVATPFYALCASPSSHRWLGVEKDSSRFVILNENFNVIRRTNLGAPNHPYINRRKIRWSPNERFALYQELIGANHFSNGVGVWLDLESGNEHELKGASYRRDLLRFVGDDGSWCIAAAIAKPEQTVVGSYEVIGGHISKHTPLNPEEAAWRFEKRWEPRGTGYCEFVVENNAASLFVLRTYDQPTRTNRHELLDLKQQTKRIAVLDSMKAQRVFGFADDDQALIILSDKRLVSLQLP